MVEGGVILEHDTHGTLVLLLDVLVLKRPSSVANTVVVFVFATEVDPFKAETSSSQNKCTTCITLKKRSPFYHYSVLFSFHQIPLPLIIGSSLCVSTCSSFYYVALCSPFLLFRDNLNSA